MGKTDGRRKAKLALPGPRERADIVQRRFKRIARKMRKNRVIRLVPNPRSRKPNEQFKKDAYRLITHYLSNEFHHTFAMALSEIGRIPETRIQPNENPFFWGLAAICGPENIFSTNQLRRIANAMNRAHDLGIPIDEIIEFLRRPHGPAI